MYCASRINKASKLSTLEITDLKLTIIKGIDNIKSAINTSKSEIVKLISFGNKSAIEDISKKYDLGKQLVVDEFTNQTETFVKEVEKNQILLTKLTDIVLGFQTHTNEGIKEHSDELEKIRDSVESLNIDVQQRGKCIQADINKVISVISEFSNSIERQLNILDETDKTNTQCLDASISSLSSLLKIQGDSIISVCRQNLSIEKEFHQKTKDSLDIMNEQLTKYLPQLKQIDKMYGNLLNLYNKLLDEENRFVKQESSISTMIERHSKILELTSEMNNTSKEIFEFMKLYLIQSTIDQNFVNNL